MAGVGKILKQAQKMQKQMEKLQEELEKHEMDVSSGGGAIKIKINGQGQFMDLQLDPEFLKEDPTFVCETLLEAIREAAKKSKDYNEEQMSQITAGMGIPGIM